MQRDYAKQVVRDKEGGEMFTTFFCIAVASVVALAFAEGTLLKHRDTLMRFVPADAVFYAHANGAEAARLLAVSTSLHARPSETATFAIEHGDTLEWTTLASWNFPRRVSSSDLSLLTSGGARIIAARTLAIGNGALPEIRGGDSSLHDDARIMRALSSIGSVSSFQGYVVPAAFLHDLLGKDTDALAPFAFGLSRHEDSFTAFALPADEAARSGMLGMRMPSNAQAVSAAAFSPRSEIALFGPAADLSPFDLLFPKRSYPNGYAQGIAEAGAALRKLFAQSSVGVSFLAESDAKDGAGKIIHVPQVRPDQAVEAIERFAVSAWPSRRPIALPDDGQSFELMIDPEHARFKPAENGFELLSVIDGPHIAVGSDGANGSLILDDPALIPSASSLTPISPSVCPGKNQPAFVDLPDASPFFLALGKNGRIPTYLKDKSLIISMGGDNLVLFCGYDEDIVDKNAKK